MAQVFDLMPRIGGPWVEQIRLTFPPIYRITGTRNDSEPCGSRAAPDDESFVGYTLNPNEAIEHRCINAKIEKLNRPDPAIDRQWVMVVHHPALAAAEAYVDGFNSASRGRLGDIEIFHTRFGTFSLATREGAPGCPPALFIFECKVEQFRKASQTWIIRNESIVIGPDGVRLDAEDTYSDP